MDVLMKKTEGRKSRDTVPFFKHNFVALYIYRFWCSKLKSFVMLFNITAEVRYKY
jgi:hypothetical protein